MTGDDELCISKPPQIGNSGVFQMLVVGCADWSQFVKSVTRFLQDSEKTPGQRAYEKVHKGKKRVQWRLLSDEVRERWESIFDEESEED